MIEDEVFARHGVKPECLEPYGFSKETDGYLYTARLDGSGFIVKIKITEDGKVSGRAYDPDTGDEYLPLHTEGQEGAFLGAVKEEYRTVLEDIADKCFSKVYFLFPQTNRITEQIRIKYGTDPDFPFEKIPTYGVFRNTENRKWYGLVMNITMDKLLGQSEKRDEKQFGKSNDGKEIEILNLKVNAARIPELLKTNGIYPCYHMNRKNWISILLDGTLPDDAIMKLVDESYALAETGTVRHTKSDGSRSWLVPANPKYYDIVHAFDHEDTIIWKQSTDIHAGDIIYMYVASPVSAILYQCEAVEVNIPYEYISPEVSMTHVMKIRRLKSYGKDEFPFSKLANFGVKAVRGPRSVPEALRKELEKENR